MIGCFWDTQTSGRTWSDGGIGKTTAEMQDIQTYLSTGWDFVGEMENGTHEVWQMPEGGGYPVLAVFNGYIPPQLRGLGTEDDPYLISDAMELGAVAHYSPYAHYRLGASIDLSGIHWAMAVIPWFAGTFDANNLTISHLRITGGGDLGLFGGLGSGTEVKDLGVVDVNITGSGAGAAVNIGPVGGLVGSNYGHATHCYSTGVVRSSCDLVGGLAGWNSGNVTCCYSTGTVSGRQLVGGLVGYNYYGDVIQCFSTGAVGALNRVGGLAGRNWYGHVTHCYSTGTVSGTVGPVGGLVGQNDGNVTCCYSTGTVSGNSASGLAGGDATACFWDTQTSGRTWSAGGSGRTTAEMQTARTFLYAGWYTCGEVAIWTIDEGQDYPRLRWEDKPGAAIQPIGLSDLLQGTGTQGDPYLVFTDQDLNLIGLALCDWDKHFKVMADIDLSGFDGKEGRPTFNIIAPDGDAAKTDFQGTPFAGVFDGNGHTISHLTIAGSGYLGLFGQLASGAEVKDLGIVDVNVTGSGDYVGGLVGKNYGVVIRCYSTGAVSGDDYLGGLVGLNAGSVSQCYSAGAVSGATQYGGLVGSNGETWPAIKGGTVTRCYSTGAVAGLAKGAVGGLVGSNYGGVLYCFWDTETSGRTTSAGGTGKKTAEMQMTSTFTGWGCDPVWTINEGKDYPRLRWENRPGNPLTYISGLAGEFVCPLGVDWLDLQFFADYWLNVDCSNNSNCHGADLNGSGTVDVKDLSIFAKKWRVVVPPGPPPPRR